MNLIKIKIEILVDMPCVIIMSTQRCFQTYNGAWVEITPKKI